MAYKSISSVRELRDIVEPVLRVSDETVEILDPSRLAEDLVDTLVWNAVFNDNHDVKHSCRWLIWTAAQAAGVCPSSIFDYYTAKGKGMDLNASVPAVNMRHMSYDFARCMFRTALANRVGPMIFEIARTEMNYTDQRPEEYTTCVLAGALREGYKGPVFIQGDHFQVNAKLYAQDPDGQVDSLKQLILEAIQAGFFNIDIDTSTLVDLNQPTIKDQQRLNYELGAQFCAFIREHEPEGTTIAVGGEIGEVGKKNSTVEELRAYMEGLNEKLAEHPTPIPGISKISVQTGTTHGGVPLPDGTVAEVKIDFQALKELSKAAREKYGMAGAVQHGASTLPDEAFDKFPETSTAEVHLATGFQNLIMDGGYLPDDMVENMYSYLRKNYGDEKKEGDSEEQFLYKTRKIATGPFKRQLWDLPESVRAEIRKDLEAKLAFLFQKLGVFGTSDSIQKTIKLVPKVKSIPVALKEEL